MPLDFRTATPSLSRTIFLPFHVLTTTKNEYFNMIGAIIGIFITLFWLVLFPIVSPIVLIYYYYPKKLYSLKNYLFQLMVISVPFILIYLLVDYLFLTSFLASFNLDQEIPGILNIFDNRGIIDSNSLLYDEIDNQIIPGVFQLILLNSAVFVIFYFFTYLIFQQNSKKQFERSGFYPQKKLQIQYSLLVSFLTTPTIHSIILIIFSFRISASARVSTYTNEGIYYYVIFIQLMAMTFLLGLIYIPLRIKWISQKLPEYGSLVLRNEQLEIQRNYKGFTDVESLLQSSKLNLDPQEYQEYLDFKGNHPNQEFNTFRLMKDAGFSSFEDYQEAQALNLSNIQQFSLVKKFNAPDYETAVKIQEGNFSSLIEYQSSIEIGIEKYDDYLNYQSLENQYPTLTSDDLLKMVKGRFTTLEDFKNAEKMNVTDIEELRMVEKYNVPNLETARGIQNGGFPDQKTYLHAKAYGFRSFEDFEKLLSIMRRTNSLKQDYFIEHFNFGTASDFLTWMQNLPINTPLTFEGDLIIFNYREEIIENKEKLKTDLIKCQVCKNTGGEFVYCPKCVNPFHKNHLLEWLKIKGSCPICKESINEEHLI